MEIPRAAAALAVSACAAALLTGCLDSSAASDSVSSETTAKPPKPKQQKEAKQAKLPPEPLPPAPSQWNPGTAGKVIYLTFDDGPGEYTKPILKVLADNDAKATFFVIGKMIRTREADIDAILEQGHAIGNHTWDHVNLNTQSAAAVNSQLARTAAAIGPGMGPCMRPPYGAVNDRTRKLEAAAGLTPILWTIDTRDWDKQATEGSIAASLKTARSGSVVLLHDGGGLRGTTVRGLAKALPELRAKGYSFETVPACR